MKYIQYKLIVSFWFKYGDHKVHKVIRRDPYWAAKKQVDAMKEVEFVQP